MPLSPTLPDKQLFRDSVCGHVVGVLLLCYAAFNTYLFVKFTPVYVATQCGDQTADLQGLSLGRTIKVALQIKVTCWNPNAYQVEIKTSEPGFVYIGEDRDYRVGQLTLVKGSHLPAQGSGDIRVQMDAELSKDTSEQLVPLLLRNPETPMFLELQFEVGVSLSFGLMNFGTTAPFTKKCGMNLAGLLVSADSRLGPMVCRASFGELQGHVPHVGEAKRGEMSFSGAQMDPDRIAMGETAKNVSIIGVGSICYIVGISLVYHWFKKLCCSGPPEEPEVKSDARYFMANQRSCLRAQSGNFYDEPPAPTSGMFGQTKNYLLGRAQNQAVYADDFDDTTAPTNCIGFRPLMSFLSCGAVGKRPPPPPAPLPPQPYLRRQCFRAHSGNLDEMEQPLA
mmetsp:Transcript_123848/g.358188  ORF Transcript_123848/g.358188 Transcript_123848/m.358188 type:complete len:394 (-) Transcript_123848:179-1360(-)